MISFLLSLSPHRVRGRTENENERDNENDFIQRRIHYAQTNCFGFAQQMANTVAWNYTSILLTSLPQLQSKLNEAMRDNKPAFIVIVLRLKANRFAGHALTLEFHPNQKQWYVFQAFQGHLQPSGGAFKHNTADALIEILHDALHTGEIHLKMIWCEPKCIVSAARATIYNSSLSTSSALFSFSLLLLVLCVVLLQQKRIRAGSRYCQWLMRKLIK